MEVIGPGVFVEVIDASPPIHKPGWPPCALPLLVAGDIHVVDDIFEHADGGLALSTDKAPIVIYADGKADAYCAERFRPISGGEPGMFSDLLKLPTRAPTKELA